MPPGAAFGTTSPGETVPSPLAKLLSGIGGHIAGVPKRAFEASEAHRGGYGYEAGPIVDAALLGMTGGVAGTGRGGVALGSGPDMSHWNALNLRLSNERNYLAKAKTDKERELRKVWISQIEKEIAHEEQFLAKKSGPLPEMSDDELLKSLLGE